MKTRTWLSFSMAVLSLLSSQAHGEDQLLRERFFNEAPDHWKHIAEVMDKVECSGNFQIFKTDKTGTPRTYSSHYKICKNGSSLLFENRMLDESLGPWEGRVAGVNSRYAFQLAQPQPSASWVASGVSAERRDRLSFEIKIGTDPIVNPYTFLAAVSLPHMFQEPGFKCLSVDPVEREGRPAAKVTFSYAATIPEPGYPSDFMNDPQGGWVILSPDDHWSIQEWKVNFAKTEFSRVVEYGETVDDYRIPRRIQGKTIDSSDPSKEYVKRFNFDYEKFTPINLPEETFSLSAYGLPESLAGGSDKWDRRYLVALLFGLAALGVLVSVMLRRRSRRSPA